MGLTGPSSQGFFNSLSLEAHGQMWQHESLSLPSIPADCAATATHTTSWMKKEEEEEEEVEEEEEDLT